MMLPSGFPLGIRDMQMSSSDPDDIEISQWGLFMDATPRTHPFPTPELLTTVCRGALKCLSEGSRSDSIPQG